MKIAISGAIIAVLIALYWRWHVRSMAEPVDPTGRENVGE